VKCVAGLRPGVAEYSISTSSNIFKHLPIFADLDYHLVI
jgi:hypothetical protein